MNITLQAQTLLSSLRDGHSTKALESLVAQKMPPLVSIILVVWIGMNLAELTWRILPAPESASVNLQQPLQKSLATGNGLDNGANLSQISTLHLFGKAGVTPVKKIEQKAPETRLNLTLHGVFVEQDPELGAAIIGTSGNQQKYYKVGANIMNGVKLQGVLEDRVLLLRNGQSEILRFPKVSDRETGSVMPVVAGSSVNTVAEQPVSAASLSEYKAVFQNEPLKIFEHVRFVPVRSRDGLKGYRVLPQKNRELYNKLGIRPSDLVTAVNGVNLTNDQEAMKLMQMLKEATSVQVDIVRNGQPQSLNFSLN